MNQKPLAYEGDQPYVFVSYAHKDDAKVYPIIEQLQQLGMRVWYDSGIKAGDEWPEYIANHIQNCDCVLVCLSEAAADSIHCRQEITFAIGEHINVLSLYLENVRLPAGLQMQLGNNQALFYNNFSSVSQLAKKIAEADIMQPSLAGSWRERTPKKPLNKSVVDSRPQRHKKGTDSPSSGSNSRSPKTSTPKRKTTFDLGARIRKALQKVNLKPILTLVAVLLLFALVVWPLLIHPNLPTDDFYTPEILQTYCATTEETSYRGETDTRDYIITITSCDKEGNLTATIEFIHNSSYEKYDILGKILKKSNNGNVTIEFRGQNGEGLSEDGNAATLDARITNNFTKLKTDGLTLSSGGNDKTDIKTVEDLQKLVNSDGFYVLKNDIDLSGRSWTPIEGFQGILLGNGHTIKGLTIQTSTDNVGFFSVLEGTVNNVNFENANISVSMRCNNVGILCGSMTTGNALNVSVSGIVEAKDGTNVGGVIGSVETKEEKTLTGLRNAATVSGASSVGGIVGSYTVKTSYSDLTTQFYDSENSGSVFGSGDYVGGGFGYFRGSQDGHSILYVSNFYNTGSITGNMYVGGTLGYSYAANGSYIQACNNNSPIEAEAYVGCIAGYAQGMEINNCTNKGSTLTATRFLVSDGDKFACVGGFAGQATEANNCTNEVEINYTEGGMYVGGIIGYINTSRDREMQDLRNTASVSGGSYVGGVFGCYYIKSSYSDITAQLDKFENNAPITGTDEYVGGLIGSFDGNQNGYRILYISDFTNTGDVKGKHYVGGILGQGYGTTESYIRNSTNQSAIEAEACVGCIAGSAENFTVSDCTNSGSTLVATRYITENGEKFAYIGGFVGKGTAANNCTNEVDIQYTAGGMCVGGIIGSITTSNNGDLSKLRNNGNISGGSHVGGIIGRYKVTTSYSNVTTQLDDFENTGTISGTGYYVGGLVGSFDGNQKDYRILYINDLVNTGMVTGKKYVGGVIGYAVGSSKSYITDSSSTTGNIAGSLSGVTIQ